MYPIRASIKEQSPLILNITNLVTMDFIANGLLSLGAAPVMSQAALEATALVNMAQGVVINIGTLDEDFIALAHVVCAAANALGKPITFDPVGAGASSYRTETCLTFLETYKIAIVRGNAGEVMALGGELGHTRGVDSKISTDQALVAATALAKRFQTSIVMSGAEDRFIHDDKVTSIQGGSSMMPSITGSGCLLTAVLSAFDAVSSSRFDALREGLQFYKDCGEHAATLAKGPGSFRMHFLDALYGL